MDSGIYKITSPSGRFYIGSAISLARRWKKHVRDLQTGVHGNINLQRAAAKYGVERLKFSILLVCSAELLLFYEQLLIDGLSPSYNIAPIAGSSRGIIRSAEFKAKVSSGSMGRLVSEETRAKIGAKHKGKRLSIEHVQRWRSGLKPVSIERRRELAAFMNTPAAKAKKIEAMKGHVVSETTKAKISAALKGRKHSAERIAAIMAGKTRSAACTLQNED